MLNLLVHDGEKYISFRQVQSTFLDMASERISHIVISGSEPVSHPEIVDIVRLCRALHIPRITLTIKDSIGKKLERTLIRAGVTDFDR